MSTLETTDTFKGASERSYRFTPHMTIAEYVSLERTEELLRELEGTVDSGSFLCSEFSYAVPDDNFHFEERKFLKLGS